MTLRRFAFLAIASLACVFLSVGCGHEPTPQAIGPNYPAFQAGPRLSNALARSADHALPEVDAETIEEVAGLLEAAALGGRLGHSATGQLHDLDAKLRTAALLAIVEDLHSEVSARRNAYAWLRDSGSPGLVPRLTLRLKYEKDLWSAVCLGDTLLRHGNGSGLDAVAGVLEREANDAAEESARSYAATVIPQLPAIEGWDAGADFAADWQRLSEIRGLWARERRLSADEGQIEAFHPEVEAEILRMAIRLASQPLRPVDDARFVLTRQRGAVIPLLFELAGDEDRYVREHALQTLSWMGPPVHAWCQARDFDYVGEVTNFLGEASLRARALEALGAGRMASATSHLVHWLQNGRREEAAAAADGLLRSADASILPQLRSWLADGPPRGVPAEGTYSLYTLWFTLEPELAIKYPPEVYAGLPEGERKRRDRWAAERLAESNARRPEQG